MKLSTLSSNLPRLQSGDVHRLISEQLSHLLPDTIQGYSCNREIVSDLVIKASVNGKAIEGTCNNLEKAPSGMTVRTYLNEALSVTQLFDLERQLQLQLQADLPRRL